MNEQAIQQLYRLAKQDGYKKSLNDFIELIHTNPNAFNQMYTLAQKDGYRKDKSEFATLVGTDPTKPEFAHVFAPQAPLKKKEATESPSEDVSLDSSSVDRAPELTQQQGFETVYSPEFTSEIDDELVSMDEEDAVKELRDRYSQYGLVFEEAGPGIDRITVRNADGSRSETFRFDPFTQAGMDQTKAQLSSFIRENAKGPQAPKFQDDLGKALHAKQSRTASRINEDGSESSHLMASYEEDGVYKVVPTLFPVDPQNQSGSEGGWIELPFEDAVRLAEARGEVYEFEDEESAQRFAEGDWKFTNTLDLEGYQFFKDRNLDYVTLREARREYDAISDTIDEYNNISYELLSETTNPLNAAMMTSLGLVDSENIEALKERREELYDVIQDDAARDAFDAWDKVLYERGQEIASEGVQQSQASTAVIKYLDEVSIQEFGYDAKTIAGGTVPIPEDKSELAKAISTEYQIQKRNLEAALATYEMGSLYFSERVNQQITSDLSENLEGFTNAIERGNAEGRAGVVLAEMAMNGGVYGDDFSEVSMRQKSEEIARLKGIASNKVTSEVLARTSNARSFGEWWNAVSDDPAEWATSLAAQSLSQMLPLTYTVVTSPLVSVVLADAAVRAMEGAPAGPAGAALGAVGGTVEGLALASGFAMEYTSSIFEVAGEKGYNMTNPDDVYKALTDESVWQEGNERGLKRGIPISIVSLLGMRLAGNVVKTSALDGTVKRVGYNLVERATLDPITEGTGELAAQIVAGQNINWVEIAAEMGGGFGTNSPGAVANMLVNVSGRENARLARDLQNTSYINNLSESGEKIVDWTNNMRKQEKITPEEQQRILLNVSRRGEAQKILDAQSELEGRSLSDRQSKQVRKRLMNLLEMRQEIDRVSESNEDISGFYSGLQRQVTDEIQEIIQTGNLSKNPVELLDIVKRSEERSGRFLFVNNNTEEEEQLSRDEFLERIDGMNDEELRTMIAEGVVPVVQGAPETQKQTLKRLIDAFQKRSTEEVDARQPAESGPSVGEEVQEVTEEEVVQEIEPIRSATKAMKEAYEANTLEAETLDGLLSHIAEKEEQGKRLTPFQKTLKEDNQARLDEVAALRMQARQEADVQAEVEILEELVDGVDIQRAPRQRLSDTEQAELNETANQVAQQAINAFNAIRSVLPEVRIRLYETPSEYNRNVAQPDSLGEYTPATKTIHLNVPLIAGINDQTTVGHEVFHALIIDTLVKDEQVQALADALFEEVRREVSKSSDIYKRAVKFSEMYPEGIRSEEALAELFGILTTSEQEITPSLRRKILDFLNKVAELLGVQDFFQFTESDVVPMMQVLSRKIRTGEEITREEVAPLERRREAAVAQEGRRVAGSRQQVQEALQADPEALAAAENLAARSQLASDFTADEIREFADRGIVSHFAPTNILEFQPEYISRTLWGYGFYFTNTLKAAEGYGERVSFVDVSNFNILDLDESFEAHLDGLDDFIKKGIAALPEERREAVQFVYDEVVDQISKRPSWKELQWGDLFINAPLGNNDYTKIITDYVASLGYDAFALSELDYTNTATFGRNIWTVFNFEKLNDNIVRNPREIQPRQQLGPEGIDPEAVRSKNRPGGKVSKGLSTRTVKGQKVVEESADLSLDFVRENAPQAYVKNANIIANYPIVRGFQAFDDITTVEEADKVYSVYSDIVADNLEWLVSNYRDQFVDISKLWYDGANQIANNIADNNPVTVEQAAGIIAALSPQNDWYQNVRAAELLVETFNIDPVMTKAMLNYQSRYANRKIDEKKKAVKKQLDALKGSRKKADKAKREAIRKAFQNVVEKEAKVMDALEGLRGKRMSEVDPMFKAYYVRLYNEVNTTKDFQVIRPDGLKGDFVKTQAGKRRRFGWGSYTEIGKAVSIYLDGSMENITSQLGENHKIRNFHNNIVDPMSEDKDITMDTHAIAAALLIPAASNTTEVKQNFGNPAASSNVGQKGLYYANQEGYFKAAERLGMLPREVQSITWEAVRGLFTDTFKSNKKKSNEIYKVWNDYANKEITIDEARERVLELSDGVNDPSWAGLISTEPRSYVRGEAIARRGEADGRDTEREGITPRQKLITDESGKPKTFYHGTNKKFDEFKPQKSFRTVLASQQEVVSPAFFFTPDREFAEDYGNIVIPVNLSFEKLVEDHIEEVTQIMKDVYKDSIEYSNGVFYFEDYQFEKNWVANVLDKESGLDWMLLDDKKFVDALKAAGFDGTKVYEDEDTSSIAAFYPRNIIRLDKPTITPRQQKQIEREMKEENGMLNIIQTGRQANISEEAIRRVLAAKGFPKVEIDAALAVPIDAFTTLPPAFNKVEGGVSEAMTLFTEVTDGIRKFMKPKKVRGKDEYTQPTKAEVREKALKLLADNPIYKDQPRQVQDELMLAVDRMVGTRANKEVQKQISEIRNNLKQRKMATRDLAANQRQLKNFIRENLVGLPDVSVSDVNRLINAIDKAKTAEEYIAQATKVLEITDRRRNKYKKQLIKEIAQFVIRKGDVKVLPSGKRKASSIDNETRLFFEAASPILRAAVKGDVNAIAQAAQLLEQNPDLQDAITKELNQEKMTLKERRLVNQSIAMSTFGDINNMSVEELLELMNELKSTRKDSIARMKANKLERARRYAANDEAATIQIRQLFPFLFNEDGSLKDENQLKREKKTIYQKMNEGKVFPGIRDFYEKASLNTVKGVMKFAGRLLSNLQTVTTLLDNEAQGQNFFTDTIYRPLTRMSENQRRGVFEQQEVLDQIANTIDGVTDGYKQIRSALLIGPVEITLRNGTVDVTSGNQLARIYALSLNDVQARKLEAAGYGPDQLAQIEAALPEEVKQFVEKTVDYLSNTYFETVNDVYESLNDVSLGYVENYFPTRTLSDPSSASIDFKDGKFLDSISTENESALKERTDTTRPVSTEAMFTDVLDLYFESMERYKAYAEGARTLSKVFATPAVDTLLKEAGLQELMTQMVGLAINPMAGRSIIDKPMTRIIDRFMGYALAFKFIQLPKQATSFINAFQDYQYRKGKATPGVDLVMFMADAAMLVLDLPAAIRQAYDTSAEFRYRLEQGFEGDVFGLESGATKFRRVTQNEGKFKNAKAVLAGLRKAGVSPTVMGDILGVMGYMINYRRNLKNGMSKAEALEAFNEYNPTQQSRRSVDKNALQFSRSELMRAFTAFGSVLFLQYNRVIQSATNIGKSIAAKQKPTAKDTRALILSYALANVFYQMTGYMFALMKGDKEDEEKAMAAMRKAASGIDMVSAIPLIGPAIEYAYLYAKGERFYDSQITNPYLSVARDTGKAVKEKDIVGAAKTLTEISLGTNIDPLIGLYNVSEDIVTGDRISDEDFYEMLGIPESQRPSK